MATAFRTLSDGELQEAIPSRGRRTAIVTGASSGIGLGIANVLITRGYQIVANSRNITKSQTLEPDASLVLVDGDVGMEETSANLVDVAVERFGRIVLLVNNAGIFISKPFTDYTANDFSNMVSTNLAGFFHATKRTIAQMRKQKFGHIVSVTTSLADQPISGVPAALTSLTKGGLQSVIKALAVEFACEGIRVNAIAPGVVDTPMHAPGSDEFLKHLHPIQRLASVSEIVEALLYLDSASFVNGEVLHVDGGAHAGKW